MLKRVAVLLSTYNGEEFVKDLINSVLSQEKVEVVIYVRDDGSTDNTTRILKQMCLEDNRIELEVGSNLGYKKSFKRLLDIIKNKDFDYVSFCDQDDIWESSKLFNAVSKMEQETNKKILGYGSNLKIVDQDLNYIEMMYTPFDIEKLSIESRLINGFVYGCTMVFNREAYQLVSKFDGEDIYSFDYYIPIIISIFGELLWDNDSKILYRQHSSNVIGANRSFKKQVNNAKSKYNNNFYSLLAYKVLNTYEIDNKNKFYDSLHLFSEYKNTKKYKRNLLCNKNVKKNTVKGSLFLKYMIFKNKF